MIDPQRELDERNAAFWDELCGSALAKQLGITRPDEEGIRRFDRAYLDYYPYLLRYVPPTLDGRRVLEIGLGFGTLSELLIDRGADYYGVDIAPGPVAMVAARMRHRGLDPTQRVFEASALALPFDNETFDAVFTVGCLHHTGNIPRGLNEIHRVLKRRGTALVMLYNASSFRQFARVRVPAARRALAGTRSSAPAFAAAVRAMYDTNSAGDAAPHTDYTAPRQARQLFSHFRSVRIEKQNFDDVMLLGGRVFIPRRRLLASVGRVLGLDLYVTATK